MAGRSVRTSLIHYSSFEAHSLFIYSLEILGAFIVLAAALLAIVYNIEAATLGLSISYALQISSTLSMLGKAAVLVVVGKNGEILGLKKGKNLLLFLIQVMSISFEKEKNFF